jgi:hypothetical protein
MMCRRFHGEPVTRIITTVPSAMLNEVNRAMAQPGHQARNCLAEFVRLALAEKIGRDLMLSGPVPTKAKGSAT